MASNKIPVAAAIAMCDLLVDRADAGAGPAAVQIWAGSEPADADTAITDGVGGYDLLAELTCSDPAAGAAADATPGGRATMDTITGDTSANKTGTAAFFRLLDSDANVVIQGDITATGGGGAMTMASTSITAGQAVDITSWTITMPESNA